MTKAIFKTSRLSRLTSIGGLMMGAWLAATPAQAHKLPDCDASSVLAKVSRQILIAEKNVVKSGDAIGELKYSRQLKVRENGPRVFAQRYCRAKGITQSGRSKTVYYLIEEKNGFIGIGYGVESCVLGRDPWKVHGANCRSVR